MKLIKMHFLFFIIFNASNLTFCQSLDLCENCPKVFSNIGVGSSTIGGIGLYFDAKLNLNGHNFGINAYHNWHRRKLSVDAWNASASIGKDELSKFSQIGIYYGRSISWKRLYYALNIGVGYFSSIKKELISLDPVVEILPDGSTYTYYPSRAEFNPYSGIGINIVSDLGFIFNEKSSMSLLIYTNNLNPKNDLMGFSITYKHCLVFSKNKTS